MEGSRGFTGQFKQYAFIWRPEFSTRRNRYYQVDDSRYVEPGVDPQMWATTTEEIIDMFVNNQCDDDVARHHYRWLQVAGFLDQANIEALRGSLVETSVSHPMVLIDDRNDQSVTRDDRNGNVRPLQPPLTAHQLYSELRQNRIGRPNFADAERRLVYITDPDPFCALGLAATVSATQALFLRDFIHKYLAYRALIGVEIKLPARGTQTFALEFHLPYYTWRRMPFIARDTRKRADGQALRRSEEVIHLQMDQLFPPKQNHADEGLNDFIYEAQLSVMITGLDDWFWTAYCFVDVYFKGSPHNEHVDYYFNSPSKPDPHCCGKTLANPPVWLAREYFLRTLTCRMEQVKQEWNNVVFQLIQHIEPCIHAFTRGETAIGKTEGLEITQQTGFKWTIRILRQFTYLLSKTIDAWDTFKDGEIRYFYLPNSDSLAQESWGSYLADIDKDVTELRDLRITLQYHTEMFENMTNSLVTHAAHAESITTRLQSEFVQALTVITIVFLPPSLASSIFSMQDTVLTGNKPTLQHWIYTVVGLSLATIILVLTTRYRKSVQIRLRYVWVSLWTCLAVCLGKRQAGRIDGVDDEFELQQTRSHPNGVGSV